MTRDTPAPPPGGHALWVRLSHWLLAVSVLTLIGSGVEILMVHPRLYWGEVGNDLTTPILELPISRNHRHGGWTAPTAFFAGADAPVSASRTFEIFNQNGWGRSLHFLAAWGLVAVGAIYLGIALAGGHFRRHLVPGREQRSLARFTREVRDHLRLVIPPATGGPQYGLLQRLAYLATILIAVPIAVLTGLTMSPAVTAAVPALLTVFGGHQSARTLHFAAFAALVAFAVVHVLMVARSGFRHQMRAMTIGGRR